MPLTKKINQNFKPQIEKGGFNVEQDRENLEQTVETDKRQEKLSDQETQTQDQTTLQITDNFGVGQPGIDISKSNLHQNIENILEEDIEEIYFSMDQITQQKFKKQGEKTTQEIINLFKNAKATFKKIFKLIFGWLKIIPGVNKFFLEQEAKIKADKILKIK